jgi:hypothetical protein
MRKLLDCGNMDDKAKCKLIILFTCLMLIGFLSGVAVGLSQVNRAHSAQVSTTTCMAVVK